MKELHKYGLVRFSKKTGKIDLTMTALGVGMMQLWALQNTMSSKACIIIDLDSRSVYAEFEGASGGFPVIRKKPEEFIYEFPEELVEHLIAEEAKRK